MARRLAIDTTNLAPSLQQASLRIAGGGGGSVAVATLLLVVASSPQTRFLGVDVVSDSTAAVRGVASVDLPLQQLMVTSNITLSSSGGPPLPKAQSIGHLVVVGGNWWGVPIANGRQERALWHAL